MSIKLAPKSPTYFRATTTLLYVLVFFWLAFAAWWLFQGTNYRCLYATAATGNAILLAVLTWLMSCGRRWAYWLLVGLMGFNVVVTIFDQIGWFDLAYLVPAILAFILLVLIGPKRTDNHPQL